MNDRDGRVHERILIVYILVFLVKHVSLPQLSAKGRMVTSHAVGVFVSQVYLLTLDMHIMAFDGALVPVPIFFLRYKYRFIAATAIQRKFLRSKIRFLVIYVNRISSIHLSELLYFKHRIHRVLKRRA